VSALVPPVIPGNLLAASVIKDNFRFMTKAIVGASTVLLVAGVAMGIFVDRQFLAKSPATGQTTEAKLPSTTVSNPPAPSVRSKPAPRIVREAGPAQIADTMTLAEARAALAVADTELDQSRRFEAINKIARALSLSDFPAALE